MSEKNLMSKEDVLNLMDEKYLKQNTTKTGTTIVGIKYSTGVVLCADTRSTNGPIVADKNCKKIHYIADKIRCCGAGTAADTRAVTAMCSKELMLFKYKYLKEPFITHGTRLVEDYLVKYGGHIGAALILGGVDSINGPSLVSISPDGNSAELDYTTMGSGSFAATSVLELEYKVGMNAEEAIELGKQAITAGIMNDLYSGSNVDIFVIDQKYNKELRNYAIVQKSLNNQQILYPKDSIKIKKEEIFKLIKEI